jgi:hypothetical protein
MDGEEVLLEEDNENIALASENAIPVTDEGDVEGEDMPIEDDVSVEDYISSAEEDLNEEEVA